MGPTPCPRLVSVSSVASTSGTCCSTNVTRYLLKGADLCLLHGPVVIPSYRVQSLQLPGVKQRCLSLRAVIQYTRVKNKANRGSPCVRLFLPGLPTLSACFLFVRDMKSTRSTCLALSKVQIWGIRSLCFCSLSQLPLPLSTPHGCPPTPFACSTDLEWI